MLPRWKIYGRKIAERGNWQKLAKLAWPSLIFGILPLLQETLYCNRYLEFSFRRLCNGYNVDVEKCKIFHGSVMIVH